MGQRGLDDLARVVGRLSRPVPEAGPEAVRNGGDAVPLEHPQHPLLVERLAVLAREHARAVAERPCRIEDLDGPATQGHFEIPWC